LPQMAASVKRAPRSRGARDPLTGAAVRRVLERRLQAAPPAAAAARWRSSCATSTISNASTTPGAM
jgi:hypothetical protein